eukprot:m51a1_g14778 hypothetical protein (208) ;mRNA; f:443482-444241
MQALFHKLFSCNSGSGSGRGPAQGSNEGQQSSRLGGHKRKSAARAHKVAPGEPTMLAKNMEPPPAPPSSVNEGLNALAETWESAQYDGDRDSCTPASLLRPKKVFGGISLGVPLARSSRSRPARKVNTLFEEEKTTTVHKKTFLMSHVDYDAVECIDIEDSDLEPYEMCETTTTTTTVRKYSVGHGPSAVHLPGGISDLEDLADLRS